MLKMKKFMITGMVFLTAMTVLAGCGNDKKAAQDGSTNVEMQPKQQLQKRFPQQMKIRKSASAPAGT